MKLQNTEIIFIKLANEGFYDDLLFHRIIPGFMIQGGDPDSKGASPGVPLGGGGQVIPLMQKLVSPTSRRFSWGASG